MPQRKTVFTNNQYYHIFNKSINKEPIFAKQKECNRALTAIDYYRFKNPPLRLSRLLALGPDRRKEIVDFLEKKSEKLINIISFVLMPNHFHLLLKQNLDNGISSFVAQFENSYTRYFNTKNRRQGHLFQGQFKAVRIEDDYQLVHVHRYIHLNPYSSYVIREIQELEKYPYSSFPEYLSKEQNGICDKSIILSRFSQLKQYKKFIFDQADYQRQLEKVKHLALE